MAKEEKVESKNPTWFWRTVKVSGIVVFAVNLVSTFMKGGGVLPYWVPPVALGFTAIGFVAFLFLIIKQPGNLPRPFLYQHFKGFIFSVAVFGVVLVISLVVYCCSFLIDAAN